MHAWLVDTDVTNFYTGLHGLFELMHGPYGPLPQYWSPRSFECLIAQAARMQQLLNDKLNLNGELVYKELSHHLERYVRLTL